MDSPTGILDRIREAFGGLELATLDLVGLGLVGVLTLLGLWRGLWWQVIRLAGIVAAVAIARTFGAELAGAIQRGWPELSPRLTHGVAWLALFLGTLGIATLLGLAGQKLLQAMQLGLANRIGGGVIGAATGLTLHVAVLVLLCQLAPETFVERVIPGTYSERLVETVGERWGVVLSGEAAAEVQRLIGREVHAAPPAGVPASAVEPGVR